MELNFGQCFKSRKEISELLGGDMQKGIAPSSKEPIIMLFTNCGELYTDYFYPKGNYTYCMYTGIGRKGHQDSVQNNMYDLNLAVLSHRAQKKQLLLFEKRNSEYYFVGEYQLMETHQNVQPDDDDTLRRVFVFHLEQVATTYQCKE